MVRLTLRKTIEARIPKIKGACLEIGQILIKERKKDRERLEIEGGGRNEVAILLHPIVAAQGGHVGGDT